MGSANQDALASASVLVGAQRVVGQGLEHIAVADMLRVAAGRDALQLSLEALQPSNLLPDELEMPCCDAVRIDAGFTWMLAQSKQFTDGIKRQSKVTGMPNKSKPLGILSGVASLIATRTMRCRD